jgi:hypothetical protein
MFSVIKNIYNKKTKGPILMELFTVTGTLKKYLKARIIAAAKNIDAPMLTRVWQEREYRIDVCRVTRGAHIEHLYFSKELFQFSCGCEQFH